jgi:Protein of unknown function (DUF4232)
MAKAAQKDTKMISMIVIAIVVLIAVFSWCMWYKGQLLAKAPCTSLSLTQGGSSGAAGTIYKNAVITNIGTKTCTLAGYPGVFMVDGGGTQVGAGAAANSLYAAVAITLAPGDQAHTVVAFPQQPNFPPGTCSPIGSSMKLYVPGVVSPVTSAWSDYSCPGFSATALQPGASS